MTLKFFGGCGMPAITPLGTVSSSDRSFPTSAPACCGVATTAAPFVMAIPALKGVSKRFVKPPYG